ncbi:MAG: HNH endonuclease, partial [Leptospiraceae bacterium]|nr:HNH endonuclease [Leptospiraceae bacterium]
EVDHIDPVSKGGENEIVNLITSCFECNNGKRDRLLSDLSVVEKQRKQLEEIQERREQIELMFEWKKGLANLDTDVVSMLTNYVNGKIAPLSLNENGGKTIHNLIKQFSIEEILDSIDEAAKKYLRLDESGEIEKDSAEIFLSKIGAFAAVKKMPPIRQKLSYIKGIAKNRFSYWDDKKGMITLSNYVKALEEHWTEQQILDDLEKEVIKLTKEAKSWTEWKNTIEKWIDDTYKWEKNVPPTPTTASLSKPEYSIPDLERHAAMTEYEQDDSIGSLIYVSRAFPNFKEEQFTTWLYNTIYYFVENCNDFDMPKAECENFIYEFIEESNVMSVYEFEVNDSSLTYLYKLKEIATTLLYDIFRSFHYPSKNYSLKDGEILIMLHKQNRECRKKIKIPTTMDIPPTSR